MALTPKQDHFCRLVASGKDYTTAYLTAYDWHGSKQGAINEAMILANKPDIQAKIQTLVKPLQVAAQTEAITEREKKRSWLWNMINNENVSESDRLRAMDILNKMDSEYINLSKNIVDSPAEIINLDTDALIKLASS